MWRSGENNIGEFQERDYGNWFTYKKTTDEWAISHGYEFQIDVNDLTGRPYRFAKILKTVAYVVVDEDENGAPVFEKWHLKRHNVFRKAS